MQKPHSRNPLKKEKEVAALITIIADSSPDILGICEVGSLVAVKEIQSRLKERGVSLPYVKIHKSFDSYRKMAILSRYPIVKNASVSDVYFRIGNQFIKSSRGILDMTIDIEGMLLRYIGIHFKSKRVSSIKTSQQIRVEEALFLRKYIASILQENPETKLIVYGDFNDTKDSETIQLVSGKKGNSPYSLKSLDLKDANGSKWTQYWKRKDIYSRFDYVFLSRNLIPHFISNRSEVISHQKWNQGSDHRALLVFFRF